MIYSTVALNNADPCLFGSASEFDTCSDMQACRQGGCLERYAVYVVFLPWLIVVKRKKMNLSRVTDQTFIGKILRLPLRLIPAQTVLPILQGPLKGEKWIIGSGVHGYWLGIYENEKQRAFTHWVKAGNVVYDIGANVGYYTLLASTLVGETGLVMAFEPLPANLIYLRKHLTLNGVYNTQIFEVAVSNENGTAMFSEMSERSVGHLERTGKLEVQVVKLDTLYENGVIPPPDVMKIDVEGAEHQVLTGALSILEEHHPVIFLATHGQEVHKQSCDLLLQLGYNLNSISSASVEMSDELLGVFI